MIPAKARLAIKDLVLDKIRSKLEEYAAETDYKPFFESIFSKEVVLKASLMQSIYTSFGMSIYEQMAIILAESAGYKASRQYKVLGTIDDETRLHIDHICDQPIGTYTKAEEVALIRDMVRPGKPEEDPDSTVDVYIKRPDGVEILCDITSVKPNKKGTRAMRQKLLEWTAMRYSVNRNAKIETYIGIPYNPYHPQEYNRSYVVQNAHYPDEVLVQEVLWAKFSGQDCFAELVGIFEEVGMEMEMEIARLFGEKIKTPDGH